MGRKSKVWYSDVNKLRLQGYTFDAIAKLYGVTRQRIHQITKGHPLEVQSKVLTNRLMEIEKLIKQRREIEEELEKLIGPL